MHLRSQLRLLGHALTELLLEVGDLVLNGLELGAQLVELLRQLVQLLRTGVWIQWWREE